MIIYSYKQLFICLTRLNKKIVSFYNKKRKIVVTNWASSNFYNYEKTVYSEACEVKLGFSGAG